MSYEHSSEQSDAFKATMQELLDVADIGLQDDPRTEVTYDSYLDKPVIVSSTYRSDPKEVAGQDPIIQTIEFLDGLPGDPQDPEDDTSTHLVRLAAEDILLSGPQIRRYLALVAQDGRSWFDVVRAKVTDGRIPGLSPQPVTVSKKDASFEPGEQHSIENMLRFVRLSLRVASVEQGKNKNSQNSGKDKADSANNEEPTVDGT